ncbi:SepM family pheromone-processing serine protease [Effusibacillus dendaii]|uniref:endopeptidase La n=1 Tax=Effusibacillus dendaii TaxID=2743772 RepID=A0A7I8D802_9BACL|nr:SepM family pheromone-processing serine protease [Effusibacillus dendaii]BCJ85139.1 hypothetical protein skT53_01240 [Effusibacillus dendaii]
MPTKSTAKKRVIRALVALVLVASLFIPLPYYVFQPGSADELQPMLSVANGQKDEKGTLMMTTVMTVPTRNIYYYLYGLVWPNRQVVPRQEVDQGMSGADYQKVLQHMMSSSQESAIVAAMRYLKMPVQMSYFGVIVAQVLPDSKAKGVLQPGDLIEQVDGKPMLKSEDLISYLANKKVGDKVRIEFTRDNQRQTADVELIGLPSQGNSGQPTRPGLGIQPITKQKVENLLKVDFHTENIGGPSAGLMFALEIVSQLTPGDLTKGHRIAGTGTIDANGNVGQIGGIEHKIVAADEKGAEIFFAPADPPNNPELTNTKDAMKKAAEIKTKMKIVPVKNLAEAVDYLQKLP